MTEHDLKVDPHFYNDLEAGRKPFEVRINDRDFKPGDTLLLREWSRDVEAATNGEHGYTGRSLRRRVGYVLHHHAGLKRGYVVMAIEEA